MRTGILHQFGIFRVLKRLLSFADVVETRLIDQVVADCPGVGGIPLLISLRDNAAESGDIGSGHLKSQRAEIFASLLK